MIILTAISKYHRFVINIRCLSLKYISIKQNAKSTSKKNIKEALVSIKDHKLSIKFKLTTKVFTNM